MPYPLYPDSNNCNAPLLQCPGERDHYIENRNPCHDKIFALLFCAQALAAIGFSGWSFSEIDKKEDFEEEDINPSRILHRYGIASVLILGISLLAGIISGMLWFKLMHHHVKALIYTGFVIQAGILIYLSTMNIGFIIPLIMLAFFFYVVRRFIPLAAFLIDTGITVLFENQGMIIFSLIMVTFQGVLVLIWLALTGVAFLRNPTLGVLTLFIISTYWVGSVASNVMHFTVCYVVGGWFLGDDRRTLCQGVRLASWQNFGSIAFGSLIVTIAHVLRTLVRSLRGRGPNGQRAAWCPLCLLDCLFSYLERLAEWVNVYALAYVALTGSSFLKAASSVWSLFQRKGFSIVINDDLVHMVLALGPIVVATVVAILFTVFMDFFWRTEHHYRAEPAIIACSFVMTFWVNLVLGQVLHSIVITLYICYLENTNDFARFHPHICHNVTDELVKAYPSYRPPPGVNPEWANLQQQRDDDYIGVV